MPGSALLLLGAGDALLLLGMGDTMLLMLGPATYAGSPEFFFPAVGGAAQELRTIPITWPFAVWGLDIVGPFSKSP